MAGNTSGKQLSGLDEAWSDWVAGRRREAIRRCTAILEADAKQIGAALLLCEALSERDARGVVRRGCERLVDAFSRRGDLPRCVVAAELLGRAGGDGKGALRRVAKTFGRGSERAADVSPAPPPLPISAPVPADLERAEGAALTERAGAALASFAEALDDAPAEGPVPRLPLFGALAPAALEELLSVWELAELSAGEAAIEEGSEGKHAYVVARGRLTAQRGRGEEATVLAELGPGSLFGEMALVSDAPRAASVVASEPAQLLVASRDSLERLAKKSEVIGEQLSAFCRERMVSNLIRHSGILRALSVQERRATMARFEAASFEAGQHLVRLGEETAGLFLIASGGVKVIGRDGDGDELQVAELGPGDVVGEISLVLRRPATADVIAAHPTVAMKLDRGQFTEAIREHPGLLGELYELATKREEEMRTVVAQRALDVEEVVLL